MGVRDQKGNNSDGLWTTRVIPQRDVRYALANELLLCAMYQFSSRFCYEDRVKSACLDVSGTCTRLHWYKLLLACSVAARKTHFSFPELPEKSDPV